MKLADFERIGLVDLLDVELAKALSAMVGSDDRTVEAAIALTSRSVRLGHACLPLDKASDEIVSSGVALPFDLPTPSAWAQALSESPLIKEGPLVLDANQRLYLRRHWQLERDIAAELAARARAGAPLTADASWRAQSLDRLFGPDRESMPRAAAVNALEHRVSVLCGGPGTGKTTTVASVVALLAEARIRQSKRPPKTLLLAPTGKAAVRLAEAVTRAKRMLSASKAALESIPDEATTLHRALGMFRDGMRFRRDAAFPIDAEVVVVDEASMVDLHLMRQLLVATPRDATLLIVGDPDQLTSVEAGSVLRDLVRASDETWWSGKVTRLRKTYRYDSSRPLGELVASIRNGDAARVRALLDSADPTDVRWTGAEGLSAELSRAAARWSEILATSDPRTHFERRGHYVVLSPYRVGRTGTQQLGRVIEAELRGSEVIPIIIEENQHELGIYNGDFGMLSDRDGTEVATIQRDPEEARELAVARLPRYSRAFALSVHKAQGSEFDELTIVMPDEDAPLLTREMLYTAVSRARESIRLVGPLEVIEGAVDRQARRFSGLVDRIAEATPLASQAQSATPHE